MAGGATNPDPEVFRFAATQVRHCLEATQRLGGENYVLWGGREGYDTLLNTNLAQEKDQLGRFISMVVEHKHKIGFKGAILIEPKPHEPTKHQYDFDVDTIYGFLLHHGLEKEVKVNIESNHATLSGHSFEHEIAMAVDFGIFGSIDMNRGDPQNGWDTDQFPYDLREITLALYYVLKGGGFTSGGNNFDAKVRRQSIDPVDLFYGHIGAVDILARGLLNAAAMLEGGEMASFVEQRYAGWRTDSAARHARGPQRRLAAMADAAVADNVTPVAETPAARNISRTWSAANSAPHGLNTAVRGAGDEALRISLADVQHGGLQVHGVRARHDVEGARLDHALHGDVPHAKARRGQGEGHGLGFPGAA